MLRIMAQSVNIFHIRKSFDITKVNKRFVYYAIYVAFEILKGQVLD